MLSEKLEPQLILKTSAPRETAVSMFDVFGPDQRQDHGLDGIVLGLLRITLSLSVVLGGLPYHIAALEPVLPGIILLVQLFDVIG